MEIYIILALRILHVVAGVLWAGAAILYVTHVKPAVQLIGPAGPVFMQAYIGRRKYPLFMQATSISCVGAGLIMFWFASGGLSTSWLLSGAFSAETWMHLAEEERYRYPFGVDLSEHMRHPLSVWAGQNRMPHDYLLSIAEDAGFAWRFTHMLYELHLSLADAVAAKLNLRGVERIMDLGGGSGVMSLAILREYPTLMAVVIDHPHVCAAGRAIAAGRPEGARLKFLPGDFTRDDLPVGYDLALECDVGVYSEAIFRRVWSALNPGGRLVIIDEFPTSLRDDDAPQRRYAFYRAMTDFPVADHMRVSIVQVQAMLARAGFKLSVERSLPDGMVIIQGKK